MKIVIAPQALKGSLSASETGEAIAQGVHRVYPDAQTHIIPVADGGEGTVQALIDATGGTLLTQSVTGPLGEQVDAQYGLLGDQRTAVIEMATCAGLPLVPPEKRDPRFTTTYGVGELIRAAFDRGCRHFILGIGGSATNDGGAGMAQALGARLTRQDGNEIERGGAALATLHAINCEHLDPRLRECHFDIACDVSNPLCGPTGASAIYGPQKGATPAMIPELDAALAHYAQCIERDLGQAVAHLPGSGAAGGLGAGLVAFLHANLRPGAAIVLEAVQLEKYICEADLVITAEGRLDAQTAYGKSVGAVAHLAKQHQRPVLALAGGLGEAYDEVYQLGIDGIITLPDGPMTLTYAMEHATTLTSQAVERALRLLAIGQALSS